MSVIKLGINDYYREIDTENEIVNVEQAIEKLLEMSIEKEPGESNFCLLKDNDNSIDFTRMSEDSFRPDILIDYDGKSELPVYEDISKDEVIKNIRLFFNDEEDKIVLIPVDQSQIENTETCPYCKFIFKTDEYKDLLDEFGHDPTPPEGYKVDSRCLEMPCPECEKDIIIEYMFEGWTMCHKSEDS